MSLKVGDRVKVYKFRGGKAHYEGVAKLIIDCHRTEGVYDIWVVQFENGYQVERHVHVEDKVTDE